MGWMTLLVDYMYCPSHVLYVVYVGDLGQARGKDWGDFGLGFLVPRAQGVLQAQRSLGPHRSMWTFSLRTPRVADPSDGSNRDGRTI